MNASDNMNFSYFLIIKTFYDIKHLFMTIFPAFGITFRLMVGTEPAVIYAFIGWFNMKIAIEVCIVAIMLSPANSGKQAQQGQIGFFKQKQPFFRSDTDIA